MYNSDIPTRAQLPSTTKLIKSTIVAIVAAIVILVTIVLPSEYAIDPTGIGKMLSLTEMGEIKQQLSAEAEADRQQKSRETESDKAKSSSLINSVINLIVSQAHAQSANPNWTDEVKITLAPGEGLEVKLEMKENAVADFSWVADGGVVNYDLHGDGSGKNISYEKGRGVASKAGALTAAFTGNHGWFWRNRNKQNVEVTLSVRGAYSNIVRPK